VCVVARRIRIACEKVYIIGWTNTCICNNIYVGWTKVCVVARRIRIACFAVAAQGVYNRVDEYIYIYMIYRLDVVYRQ